MLSLKFIKKIYLKEQFKPGFIGLFINPFYFARKGLFENIMPLAYFITGKTLDIGCGQKPYQKLYQASEYIGLEIDSPENLLSKNADYFYDGTVFPFVDDEFDSVVANQVFEHVFNPVEFIAEINRVLKNQGVFLMSVPFVWDEHEQPFDYARYSSFALVSLLEKHGFKIVEHKKSMSDIRVIFQLINSYLYKKTNVKNTSINLLTTFFLMSPFNILGELLSLILPGNEDLYLDNIILAKKIKSL
jgi:SAM-dependent methyltransferase